MQGFRGGQGPPPPHWAPYDPRWSGMPHFMDPRYGPRPPLDMQGMSSLYGIKVDIINYLRICSFLMKRS